MPLPVLESISLQEPLQQSPEEEHTPPFARQAHLPLWHRLEQHLVLSVPQLPLIGKQVVGASPVGEQILFAPDLPEQQSLAFKANQPSGEQAH